MANLVHKISVGGVFFFKVALPFGVIEGLRFDFFVNFPYNCHYSEWVKGRGAMKFTVNRDEFYNLLSVANEVVSPKNPLAILVNIYLSVDEEGNVLIQGYNGEHGVKLEMTGQVDQSGTILLHARKLYDIVSKITTPHISIFTEENNPYEVVISSPEDKHILYKLHGSNADNFPAFQEYTWENYVVLSQETMKELIDMTEYAVAEDTAKIFFMGYYIEENVPGWITFVTTDGRQLALLSREYEDKKGECQWNVLIPGSLIKVVKKALSTGEVRLAIRGQNVFFKIGNIYFFSGLLDGKFPNYRDVLPSTINYTVDIPTAEFRKNLERVAVMTEGEVPKIICEIEPGVLHLKTRHSIYGEATASFEVEYTGEPLQLGFNGKHLMNFLRVVKADKISLQMKSVESPVQFTLKSDEHFIYIVMPIRNF